MSSPWVAALVALFVWWFSTGAILLVVRHADRLSLVGIAQAIIHRPDVLILDEPTRGIDVGAKYEIYTIINKLAAAGKGIIVISSELPELLGISDRLYAISEGRITGELPVEDATPESVLKLMTMEKAR